ncbi:redoxin domain-containing protein [uncultured Kordia sp.]|uniref:redoxin domain-containing protein n=1 Tax=uncultured Kordia sp. TaxID=507699 RepID=UPI002609541E|nr:redoxin domain-containing protein [uncultured Kordia sp.]
MKKLTILLMLMALTSITYAQTKLEIGDTVPNVEFSNLLNASDSKTSLSALKGKIVILDFWATWCGPCIPAMKNLIKLQDEFPNDIQVIGIAEDKPERLQRFIDNSPSKVWFGLQTEAFEKLFPYRILSHAIIIDPKGKIVAITATDNITKEVIEAVKAGTEISLPFKQENTEFDYEADPFPAKDVTAERVLLKSGFEGVASYSKGYLKDKTFNGRRVTIINQTIPSMYRNLYQKTYTRTVFEIDEEKYSYKNPKNKYCLDIITKNADGSMYALGIAKLKATFPVKAKLSTRKIPVYVLNVIDRSKLKSLKSKTAERSLEFRGYEFHAKKIRMADFSDYIENETPVPVVDETGYMELMDIDFVFDPQQKNSFKVALAKIGLKLTKAEREVELLIIYED